MYTNTKHQYDVVHLFFFSSLFTRFRHLDATVRLTPSRRNSATGGGSSPSPENENGSITTLRSPKRSPVPIRKRGTSPNPPHAVENGRTNGQSQK